MNIKRLHYKKGGAMIIAVIFFLVISSIIVTGVSSPVLREVKLAQDLVLAKQSLYSAESGMEDVVYRIKNAKNVGTSESLSLLGYTTQTSVADIAGGKNVVSEGDQSGYIRKITTNLTTGVGVAFNYGVQTGNGGFQMNNGATVTGNVYSNGDIVGSSGAKITGSAVAANSAALAADQSNTTPAVPTSDIMFGDTNATQDFAQSFQVSTLAPVNKVRLYLKKVGTPGNATVRIVNNSGGSPSGSTIVSGTLSAATVTSNYGWVDVSFSSNPTLSVGTTYWLVIDGATNSSRYYVIGGSTDYVGGSAQLGRFGSTWGTSVDDGYFELFLGGVYSKIEQVQVGTVGTDLAHAHTVNNSTVSGSLYCQTGIGNNKACDTSLADPVPQGFPISDGNILQWKSDAEAGGTHIGDYSMAGGASSLGPIKVTGDLNLDNGHVLTITGTVWVEGNVNISNNAQVRLSPSYGGNSGLLVADGYVRLSNNAIFSGSGASASYVMLLTTSDCPLSASCSGNYAIYAGNNAGAVILNAQKGTLYFSNNSGAKEATAHKIIMANNATVTYESGLAAPSFTSGPSGGWEINSWEETQ